MMEIEKFKLDGMEELSSELHIDITIKEGTVYASKDDKTVTVCSLNPKRYREMLSAITNAAIGLHKSYDEYALEFYLNNSIESIYDSNGDYIVDTIGCRSEDNYQKMYYCNLRSGKGILIAHSESLCRYVSIFGDGRRLSTEDLRSMMSISTAHGLSIIEPCLKTIYAKCLAYPLYEGFVDIVCASLHKEGFSLSFYQDISRLLRENMILKRR